MWLRVQSKSAAPAPARVTFPRVPCHSAVSIVERLNAFEVKVRDARPRQWIKKRAAVALTGIEPANETPHFQRHTRSRRRFEVNCGPVESDTTCIGSSPVRCCPTSLRSRRPSSSSNARQITFPVRAGHQWSGKRQPESLRCHIRPEPHVDARWQAQTGFCWKLNACAIEYFPFDLRCGHRFIADGFDLELCTLLAPEMVSAA